LTTFRQFRSQLLEELLKLAPPAGAADGAATPGAGLSFTRPPKPEMGDLALGVFPLASALRRPPVEIAKQWAEAVRDDIASSASALRKLEIPITRVETQGPYLNLTLEPAALARLIVAGVCAQGPDYGRAEARSGLTVALEYSSPNTNKPLHLGHVRNNLIGMSLSNILEAAGDRVIRLSLINDRGIHICQSMHAYREWGFKDGIRDTPEASGEKGDHFVGRYYVLFSRKLQEERQEFARARGVDLSLWSKQAIRGLTDKEEQKRRTEDSERFQEEFLRASRLMGAAGELLRRWEAGDPDVLALWHTMNEWVYEGFRRTYARLGCRFDRWDFESDTWKIGKREIERGLESGVFYRAEDGSVWARLSDVGLQDKILLRSDGTSVYITQDIGTAVRRSDDFHMDRSIYVVGSEQVAHFNNLFAIFKLLGYPWASRCHHASYGMITLPGGRGKLKSREGVTVDADDLLEELKTLALAKIKEGGYCETPEAAEEAAEWIGQGALKLYILQVSSEKNIQFDPEQTIAFTGDTGPAVQYSHARIHGILRKGIAGGALSPEELEGGSGHGPFLRPGSYDAALLSQPEEREVLRRLAEYPDMVELSARQLSAAPVANALLDLTKAYARMYHEHEVLRAGDPALLRARLQLALCVAQALRNGLALLTIEAPERM
jgi:arginyl-tRNA synthetase